MDETQEYSAWKTDLETRFPGQPPATTETEVAPATSPMSPAPVSPVTPTPVLPAQDEYETWKTGFEKQFEPQPPVPKPAGEVQFPTPEPSPTPAQPEPLPEALAPAPLQEESLPTRAFKEFGRFSAAANKPVLETVQGFLRGLENVMAVPYRVASGDWESPTPHNLTWLTGKALEVAAPEKMIEEAHPATKFLGNLLGGLESYMLPTKTMGAAGVVLPHATLMQKFGSNLITFGATDVYQTVGAGGNDEQVRDALIKSIPTAALFTVAQSIPFNKLTQNPWLTKALESTATGTAFAGSHAMGGETDPAALAVSFLTGFGLHAVTSGMPRYQKGFSPEQMKEFWDKHFQDYAVDWKETNKVTEERWAAVKEILDTIKQEPVREPEPAKPVLDQFGRPAAPDEIQAALAKQPFERNAHEKFLADQAQREAREEIQPPAAARIPGIIPGVAARERANVGELSVDRLQRAVDVVGNSSAGKELGDLLEGNQNTLANAFRVPGDTRGLPEITNRIAELTYKLEDTGDPAVAKELHDFINSNLGALKGLPRWPIGEAPPAAPSAPIPPGIAPPPKATPEAAPRTPSAPIGVSGGETQRASEMAQGVRRTPPPPRMPPEAPAPPVTTAGDAAQTLGARKPPTPTITPSEIMPPAAAGEVVSEAKAPVEARAKEPWEMRRDDWVGERLDRNAFTKKEDKWIGVDSQGNEYDATAEVTSDKFGIGRELRNQHKIFLEEALAKGKPVPPEVLADYPDLAKSPTEAPTTEGVPTPAEERAAFRARFGTARGVGAPEGLVSKPGTLDRALETGNLAAIVRHYRGFRSDSELIKNFEPEEQRRIYLFSRKAKGGFPAQGPDELVAELKANHPEEFGHVENGEHLLRMIANNDIYKKSHLDKMIADVEEGYAALEKDAAAEGYSPEDVARATAEDQELQRAERDAIISEGGAGPYDFEDFWRGVEEEPLALRAGAPKPTALETRLDTLEADYPGIDREKAATVIRALPNAEDGQVVNMAADLMFAQVARGNLAASEKAQLLKKATDAGAQQGLPGMGGVSGAGGLFAPPPASGKKYSIQEARQYAPVFFSQMANHLEAKLPGKGSGADLAKIIEGWGNKGQFKADELKWSGLVPWLREQKGPVTKQQVTDFLRENQVEVREVQKSTESKPLEWQQESDGRWFSNDKNGNIYWIGKENDGWYWISTPHGRTERFRVLADAKNRAEAYNQQTGRTDVKFQSYLRLPAGGQNYREVLLTVPKTFPQPTREGIEKREAVYIKYREAINKLTESINSTGITPAERRVLEVDRETLENKRDMEADKEYQLPADIAAKKEDFTVPSAHAYGDTAADVNRFAHIFMDDRVIDGKKYLTIWEMQSDWAGEGRRRGYQTGEKEYFLLTPDGVRVMGFDNKPDAESYLKDYAGKGYYLREEKVGEVPPLPFAKNWHEVALKKALRMAAEEGYSGLAWASGNMVKDRYDLSKQVSKVVYYKDGTLVAFDLSGENVLSEKVPENKVQDYIGKDAAEKLLAKSPGSRELVGEDLKVGGEWANRQYDQMMPQFLNKYGKQWGTKVGEGEIGTAEEPAQYKVVTELENWKRRGETLGIERPRNPNDPIVVIEMSDGSIYKTGPDSFSSRQAAEDWATKANREENKPEPIHTLPITPEMKESVLIKGQPMFRAGEEAALARGLTTDQIKSRLGKYGTVSEVGEDAMGEKYNRGWLVKLNNGQMTFIYESKAGSLELLPGGESLGPDYAALGIKSLGPNQRIAGAFRPVSFGSVIELARGEGIRTFDHESWHTIEHWLLTPKEREAIRKQFGDNEEVRAEAYANWNPKEAPNTIFQKILDFFQRITKAITGYQTGEDVFSKARSGEMFAREPVERRLPVPFAPAPTQTPAPELRYLVRNTRFAQDPAVKRVEDMFERSETAFKELRTPKLKEHWENLKRLTIDTSANIKKELLARGGDAGRKVEMMHDLMRGASAKGESIFREAEDKIYTGLSKAEEIILNRIIQARRVMAIEAYKPDLMHPEMIGGAEYQAYLDSIPQDMAAKLMPRADAYFSAWQDNLTAARDAGLINDEAYQAMVNHEYSPRQFIQHIDPEGTGFDARGRKITVPESGIKKLKEGSDQLLNMDSKLMLAQGITRTQARIFKNNANLALYGLAQEAPDNGFVRIDPSKPGPQETQVKVMIDGQPTQMVMPDQFAREWVHSDPMISAQMATVLGYATGSKLLRATATGMNPGFAITNIFRDLAHIWLTTHEYSSFAPKFTLQMGKDIMEVMGDVIRRKGAYKQYINEGGGMSFLTNQGQEQRLTGTLGKIQHYLGWIGETSEILTRLALRNRALKNGLNPLEATWTARNYLDFSQGGSFSKAVDSAVPYLNASIQGTRGIFRAARTDPKLFTWKVAQIGAMATGLYLANQLINPDGWDEIPENEKVTNWIITTPFSYIDEMGNKRYHYIRIAKDQGQRIFASAFEGAMGLLMGKKVDGDQIASAMTDFLPIVPSEKLPPALQAMLGYYSNKDFWRNKDIWQGPKVEASEEYTKYTNPVLIKAGELTGTSPERLGYALGSMVPATNTFVALVGGGIKSLVSDLPEKDRQSVLETISKPITSKFLRTTDPYTPYVKDIEELSVAESTMKLKQRRGLEKLIDANIDRPAEERMEIYRGYIAQQAPEDTKRLIREVKNYEAYHDLTDRRWWLKLSHLDPEVRAEAFYKRYKNLNSDEQERLSELAKKLPGINSDRFKAKLYQLDSGLEMPEVNEPALNKGLAEAMGFAAKKGRKSRKPSPYAALGF